MSSLTRLVFQYAYAETADPQIRKIDKLLSKL